jgi:hypothetical protein
MRQRIALLVTLLGAAQFTVAPLSVAHAGIWAWGCQGELPGQQLLFNRDALYVVDSKTQVGKTPVGKAPAVKAKKFSADALNDAIVAAKKSENFAEFDSNSDDGLASPIPFSLTDPKRQKQKVVFTEKSSRLISHRHRKICWRDENTDLYRKIYSYQRDGEAAHDVTMQCYEYQLSTRGDHFSCD